MSKLLSISERRAQYPINERLVVYDTESMQRMLDRKYQVALQQPTQQQEKLMVNGVNILNKNSVDSDTMMHRIIQRRQTHNRIERRRRDKMNNLFNLLSNSLPSIRHKNDNNRADILQEAIEYIKLIEKENDRLKRRDNGSRSAALPEEEDDIASVASSSSGGSSIGSINFILSFPPTTPLNNLVYVHSPPPTHNTPLPLLPHIVKEPNMHQYESIITFD